MQWLSSDLVPETTILITKSYLGTKVLKYGWSERVTASPSRNGVFLRSTLKEVAADRLRYLKYGWTLYRGSPLTRLDIIGVVLVQPEVQLDSHVASLVSASQWAYISMYYLEGTWFSPSRNGVFLRTCSWLGHIKSIAIPE